VTAPRRAAVVGERVVPAARSVARRRADALRDGALPIAQTAVAAGLAWLVATEVAGHPRPFFAPIAATIALGLALAQRGRRAVELVAGVTLGIVVGDLLVRAVGTGPAQIGVFVALAMTAAILLGGAPLVVAQATVSAVLVAALPPPEGSFDFSRALDAVIGGVLALAVHALLPVDALGRARKAADPLLADLAAVLEDVAGALERRDGDAAEAALDRARTVDADLERFRESVGAGQDTAHTALSRRGTGARLDVLSAAAEQLDFAVRNVRVLARGVIRALLLEDRVPDGVPAAIRDLAVAVEAVGEGLRGGEAAADARERARVLALRAAGRATLVLDGTANLSVSALVAQVRATAVDLLRSLGVDQDEATRAVREAAREAAASA
jgi:hypothetical protein